MRADAPGLATFRDYPCIAQRDDLPTTLGLRVSELLALKWRDVDWLGAEVNIERGIVKQIVDDVKTDSSRKSLTIDRELLEVLKVWKQTTQFSTDEDWIFASPAKLGGLPYSYTGFWRELQRAAKVAGIGHLGTHTFRTHVPELSRRGGNPDCRSAEADAAFGHPHDHEHDGDPYLTQKLAGICGARRAPAAP